MGTLSQRVRNARVGAGVVVALTVASAAIPACRGKTLGAGRVRGAAVPEHVIAVRDEAQKLAATSAAAAANMAPPDKQILFGDLHVHSIFSADAFLMSLPLLQGDGVHPVADACDFARYCSALDFWAITDHAESLTPRRWRETIDSIRQCERPGSTREHERAASGRGGAVSTTTDLVSFLGWEWTQIGLTADEHFGHRNVVLKDIDDAGVPRRPVAASAFAGQVMSDKLPLTVRYLLPQIDWKSRGRYLDFLEYWRETRNTEECPPGVDAADIRDACMDFAKTPSELFDRLDEWNVEAMVISHGSSWGTYTPPGYFLDKSLRGNQNDDKRQRLVEVYSGDGNAEEYRSWREANVDPQGHLVCPEPTPDYEPCCWRAGEIIRSRCEDPSSDECASRVDDARRNHLAAGASGRLTVSGADVAAWGACGQCLDCFDPPFEPRPGGSLQYALALTDFTDPEKPRRFHVGFIGSSDNHSARPGTGYKEILRHQMTDAFGPRSSFWRRWTRPLGKVQPESEAIDPKNNRFQRFQILDFERASSFLYTGGLVALHAERRDRDAVWQALERREVYATSGERILLWFDLLRGTGEAAGGSAGAVATMGSSVDWSGTPRFRVRAVGSPEQKAGCPESATEGLSAERLQRLCGGECYNPGDTRHAISRIEVVRIRPQVRPGEPIAGLIEDPWKTLPCPAGASQCVGEFEDPGFAEGSRDAIYYVRAIQAPTPAINAGGLRCARDEHGSCTGVSPCYGDWRTPYDDDCLGPSEERAWSSPIYLTWKAGAPAEASLSSSPR